MDVLTVAAGMVGGAVMDVLAAATQMERDGTHVCHLEVGNPICVVGAGEMGHPERPASLCLCPGSYRSDSLNQEHRRR